MWRWPSDRWTLIGYERWGYSKKKGDRLLEAYYVSPNPSTTHSPEPPNGHYHIVDAPNGDASRSWWYDDLLEDDHSFLKGGVTGPKGGWPKGSITGPKGGSSGHGSAAPKGSQGMGKGACKRKGKVGKGKKGEDA